ncbi:MAG: type II toxin-antitoxin system VapC family toxin [Rickettsia endosymbiont of Ixodes persulcatus]|nr:type II toxin-antitoxin system VapC family toxin [Rickettsia endosymbiont of Ixodes persulcatus]MCZ6903091.1 type II toxin-antitoxin system VapC family toxin [Rickettsia endosymbiont of Ixodes persulcatus]MCZ6919499.1 type II toxin-antitoxin system VapC family toxin [Rickettsia endosymbiont of Ixodes persulcatus]
MNNIVLDTSALLALIQNERGSEIIKPLLSYSVMSTVNITEVLTALKRTNIDTAEILTLITDFIAIIVPFDLEQAKYAAELQAYTQYKGLSLGDRACIALGVKLNTTIYTADKIWAELKIKDANIKLIR